jgi:glycosyltransferase involved in cell wall biosynthesis
VSATQDVTFSIVIPTRNRPRQLASCLAAVAKLDFPRDRFEVVVVDDGGDSPFDDVIEHARADLDVRLMRREHAGPGAARNAGAAVARHAFLAFTDDDCMPEPAWLSCLAVALASDRARLVGGRVDNALPDNLYAQASQDLIAYLYGYYNGDAARFFCSNNLAVSRDGFLAAGGFDTAFEKAAGEDRDFCDRWQFDGRPLHYAADAVVRHAHGLDARGFWLQHVRYGRGAVQYQRRYAERRGQGVRVEPVRFYAGLVAYPFSRQPLVRALACATLLAVSQVANAAGFFTESRRPRASSGGRGDLRPSPGPRSNGQTVAESKHRA